MITSQMIMKLQDPASNFQGVGYMMINETALYDSYLFVFICILLLLGYQDFAIC